MASKKNFCLLVFLLFLQKSFAQNLTGTWLGVDNDYRMVLVQVNDSCFGYTYDTGMGYCKADFVGKFDSLTQRLKGTNTGFIERTITHSLSNYKLNHLVYNNVQYLEGRLTPKRTISKILSFGIGEPLRYRKISENIDSTAFIAKKLASASQAASVAISKKDIQDTIAAPVAIKVPDSSLLTIQKNSRTSSLVNSLTVSTDSIRLLLFDNGEIDNDTVTVFLNDRILIDRLGLRAASYEKWVVFQPGDTLYRIELMANNLGSIPPNTANLVIWAGKQRFELRLSSDYTRNAVIDIIKNPKPGSGN